MAKQQSVDKNTQAECITQAEDLSEKTSARLAIKAAVTKFYSGPSLPIKPRGGLRSLSAVNFDSGDEDRPRTAAAIALIITYWDVQPDGTFIRGSGRVPGQLIGHADKTFAVGLESGVLSQLLSSGLHRCTYVSGPLVGPGVENSVYRLDFGACRACLLRHNSKTRVFTESLRSLSTIQKRSGETTETETNNPSDATLEPSDGPLSSAPLADPVPTIDEPHINGEQGEHDGKASRLGWGGPAESDEHKRLKEYIANNPSRINMVRTGETEHKFESNDEADVYFGDPHQPCVVEVKSHISFDTDLKRGIYQCVKYRALAKAECQAKGESIHTVETVLVIQRELPANLKNLAEMFGIRDVVVDRAEVPLGEVPLR